MEPVSAFALACGVIQVIQASYDLVNVAKELYRRGSLEQFVLLREQVSQMEDLVAIMNSRRSSTSFDQAEQQQHEELVTLVDKANGTAQELLKLLSKLEPSGSKNAWQALKKSPEVTWKMSSIQSLTKTMDSYRVLLDTRILVNLW